MEQHVEPVPTEHARHQHLVPDELAPWRHEARMDVGKLSVRPEAVPIAEIQVKLVLRGVLDQVPGHVARIHADPASLLVSPQHDADAHFGRYSNCTLPPPVN
jgi:hypothetical protein